MTQVNKESLRGYIEGYYGRLLTWPERHRVLDALSTLGMNCYFYAPKEDAAHRLRWRDAYSDDWREAFRSFCAAAKKKQINVLVGIAPGLDFNFAHIDGGPDHHALVNKSQMHLADGASDIVLCMDDIDDNFAQRRGSFESEGAAHAALANTLSTSLAAPIYVVPRVYANTIAVDSPSYPEDFATMIGKQNPVMLCGSDIVAKTVSPDDFNLYSNHMNNRIIVWDNLYANDYCPRRLFVGPWCGRDTMPDVLLNPTGLIETDLLLLALMAASSNDGDKKSIWLNVMRNFSVPDEFETLARFFHHPPFHGQVETELTVTEGMLDALEFLLWKWKTPLSREWFRYLMELKQDLLLYKRELPADRIFKTQTLPLALTLAVD